MSKLYANFISNMSCHLTTCIFTPCLSQMFFQAKFFIPDPIANDVKYQASSQPFLVFGLLTTGLAIGHANAVLGQ